MSTEQWTSERFEKMTQPEKVTISFIFADLCRG
jgi:hypothetical protein